MNDEQLEQAADNDDVNAKTIAFIRAFRALWPNAQNGPAHVVLSDYNVDDLSIETCAIATRKASEEDYAKGAMFYGPAQREWRATISFLQCIREIPDDRR